MPQEQNEDKNYTALQREIAKNKTLWNLFIKDEEYTTKKVDSHGRFLFQFSQQKNPMDPVVSQYLFNAGYHPEYPDKKKFAVVLTHDIDDIYVALPHIFFSLSILPKHQDLATLRKMIYSIVRKQSSPYLNIKDILELEERYNAHSSFYFLATDTDILRYRYNIRDLETEIRTIQENGSEVGLHTGYFSFNDLEKIKEEKNTLEKLLGQKIVGVRNHFLRFSVPGTWELLSNAGFAYDTSFGYPDMIGFRNGLCYPFQPFNREKERKINILELPLNIMDTTFFNYMKVDVRKGWELIKTLIDTIERLNGVLTILWHNTTFALPNRREWSKLYEHILGYCKEKNAWLTSGKDLQSYISKNPFSM